MSSVTSLAPDIPASDGDRQVLAFVQDAGLAETVAAALPTADIRAGDVRAAVPAMSQPGAAGLVIVELGDTEAPEGAVGALRSVCGPDIRILAIGTVNDVAFYRELITAGADDYLVHPAGADALTRAVKRLASDRSAREDKEHRARKIFVTGVRGGAGASTFVAGAGWHLAMARELKTAIVDLDLVFGTAALGFDIEPSHGLREVLENPERVDGLFIESALAQIGDNLAILAAEEDFRDPPAIRPGAMDLLLRELDRRYDCILVDIPVHEIVAEPKLIAAADTLVLIGEMNLTTIRDVQRLRDFLADSGIEVPVRILAGKVSPRDKGEVPQKEFVRSLSLPVADSLPFDAEAVAAAARGGRPVTDIVPKSPLSRAVTVAADELCTALFDRGKSGGLWQRLKRRG